MIYPIRITVYKTEENEIQDTPQNTGHIILRNEIKQKIYKSIKLTQGLHQNSNLGKKKHLLSLMETFA